ncbi:PmoA family protein [Actomonas aquatica]|uniref:PmoA family protein n=1 Tax=Actomonas aquatica TaxID=2866162 RepID=A0ABZ1C5C2_9BACT|nr:PmoA family protein [Opitutus sp. WL0086]WRQ86937.1 PmoA family protein [Opitutus sp. WL0086]
MTTRRLSLLVLSFSLLAGLVAASPKLQVVEDADTLTVTRGETTVLAYRKTPLPLPEGVDPVFARTGYIHPLVTPAGGVVTSVYAPDHYHHLGLWHAWVKTHHRGRALDFWNIGGKTAGIRHAAVRETWADATSAGFAVELEHYACKAGTAEVGEIILREVLRVTVREADGVYLVDYDTVTTNVSSAPLELEAYRYGGPLAYRGPMDWDAQNSRYLTSEGLGRADGHATRARWVEMAGPVATPAGRGGVVVMGHPDNRDAPQRVRIWDDGRVFFNYVPAQENAFAINPGATVSWRYRVVVFDGELSVERIEACWDAYTAVEDSAPSH